ncbi:MAG: RidA family protein [Telmatospirillum sp.]|nr:RidA family protein [Telmatospirillum sp.]
MSDIQRTNVAARYSDVAVHQGTIYLAGQIADDPTQDIRGQTAQVLATVDKLLQQHDSDKTRILQCVIYLSDISLFAGMNDVWDNWVPKGSAPPRATVEARLFAPEYLVEMVVTAAQR